MCHHYLEIIRYTIVTTACVLFPLCSPAQQRITIGLVGDIMLGRSYPASACKVMPASSARTYLNVISPVLKRNDLNIGNLESALIDGKGRMLKSISPLHYSFKTPTRYARDLKAAGFNVLTIANNHTMDFGYGGRESTVQALNNAGIAFAGFHDKYKYASFKRKGLKIAVCAFSFGPAFLSVNNQNTATKLIRQLKQKHDIIIVSVHYGNEGLKFKHVPFQCEWTGGRKRGNIYHFSHACIDAGASLIFGHGPHVPRAMELYKDHLIAYSLGNFCTPYEISLREAGAYAPLLNVQMNNHGIFMSGVINSFIQIKGHGPTIDKKKHSLIEISNLTKADFPHTLLAFSPNGYFMKQQGKRKL